MDEEDLPRSAVSLVRELFEEVLGQYDELQRFLFDEYQTSGSTGEAERYHEGQMAEYRRRFEAIAANLHSGPNSGR